MKWEFEHNFVPLSGRCCRTMTVGGSHLKFMWLEARRMSKDVAVDKVSRTRKRRSVGRAYFHLVQLVT